MSRVVIFALRSIANLVKSDFNRSVKHLATQNVSLQACFYKKAVGKKNVHTSN
jgi:hypothetical protein